ncbi:MAG: restriction endonuclease subunit S [Micrococcales bacterium]|nr:restriction endonuclease subunit S [Micrococcales bacterium]
MIPNTVARDLKSISAFITKGATPTTYGFNWEQSGVPFLRSECVSSRGLDLRQAMFISPAADAALARSRVRDGDILMTITGNVGRVAILVGLGSANINQHIARVRVADSSFDPDFVYHYLSQPTIRAHYESITTGQAYPQISLTQVRSTLVPALPLPEQQAIARALTTADNYVHSIKQLITKKRDIKLGMMQELLTGKTRLPGFSGDWHTRKIGDFTDVKAGGTPPTGIERYWGGDIRWMSSGEVHQKRVREVVGRITRDGLTESAAQILPVGTVLMALAGQGKTRGTVAVSHVELTTNQSIAGILPSEEHDSDFLYYNLDTRYDELRGESTGDGGRGGLNLTIIKKLDVLMPDVEEQSAIAEVLAAADAEITVLERRLESAGAVKQGMMQELLTGRTRLAAEGVAA